MQQGAGPGPEGSSGGLTVMALFKNEADILGEWASHYLLQGASQLILINNNSSDDWRSALGPLGQDPRLVCLNDPRIHSQERIYNDVRRSGLIEGHWLLVCDLDEFVYARPPFTRISDYLRQLAADVTSVAIPWKLFGSSGHIRHPDGRTIDNFQRRKQASEPVLIKTISRIAALEHLWVHHSRLRWGRCIRPDGSDAIQETAGWLSSTEAQLSQEVLHLNHYAVRSREFFERVKATRGDVYSQSNLRDGHYFERFDHNELHDGELARLSAGWASPAPPASALALGPPLFQLLHTAPCLHGKPGEPAAEIRGEWSSPAPEGGRGRLGIQGGTLPGRLEDVPAFLPGLASALSLPLDPGLPLVLRGEQGQGGSRRAIEQWLALLQNRNPLVWKEQTPTPFAPLAISHAQACDRWRVLAQRLAANGSVEKALSHQQRQAIVLVPCRGRTTQQRRLNQLLKRASQQLNLPRVKLWKRQPLEQLQLFRSCQWLVGPYQPALQLVHALGAMPGQRARVVLLCPGQQTKALLGSMELIEAIPHRLLLLPQGSQARLAAVLEALAWISQSNRAAA